MPRSRQLIAGALLLAAALTTAPAAIARSDGSAAACPFSGQNPSNLSPAEAEQSVTCLINKARRQNGARRLAVDPMLESAAGGHSAAMDSGNFFGHGDTLGRIRSTGYLGGASAWSVGENIHWGTGGKGTPKATVARWLGSSVHRSTMLSPRFRDIGIGVAIGSPVGDGGANTAIYTADFGLNR